MAGGKGTRVLSLTNDVIPKSMLPILGKPILCHQIESFQRNGIVNITIICGHKGKSIEDYLGNGNVFGVNITYVYEDTPLGTAGALYYLKDKIKEDFVYIFGDIIFDIDIQRMMQYHNERNSCVTMFAHPNSHPFDSDLLITDENDSVLAFDFKDNIRDYYYDNCVSAGIFCLSPEILQYIKEPVKLHIEKNIINAILTQKRVFAYRSSEYAKDVGTPERIISAEKDLEKGIVYNRNLKRKQKCIFLDRDGTINRYVGLVDTPDKLELEDQAIEAIKLINRSDYLSIIITNQPVVARGLCEIKDVENIHNKLKTLLGNCGAYVDDIFYCPHHPDKGYPEENPSYKIKCNCRKPAIGMLEAAANKYNISLSNSYFIGDSTVDIKTGKNAGCCTIIVETGERGKDGRYNIEADYKAKNLYDAVQIILNKD